METTIAALQESRDAFRELVYRLSHDFKTPLIGISHLAACLKEDLDAGDFKSVACTADQIQARIDRMEALLRDILQLAKCDSEHESAGTFDFSRFFAHFIQSEAAAIATAEVTLHLNLQHQEPFSVQSQRLTEVLHILLDNAVKFVDPLKPSHAVTLRTADDGALLHISVVDNGLGFPAGRHREVFGMFKHFHQTTASGSGLGLYLAKMHVTKMAGQITFASSPEGSVFHVQLPKKACGRHSQCGPGD